MAREFGLFYNDELSPLAGVAQFCVWAGLTLETAHDYEWRYRDDDQPHTTAAAEALAPNGAALRLYLTPQATNNPLGLNRLLAFSDLPDDPIYEDAVYAAAIAFFNHYPHAASFGTTGRTLIVQADGQLQVSNRQPLPSLDGLIKPYLLTDFARR